MKVLEVTKASLSLSEYTRDLNGGTVVLTKEGKPMLERSHKRYLKNGGVTTDQLRRRLKARRGQKHSNKRSRA